MPKFHVQVGRDARVYYSAEIEAESLEEAKSRISRWGYKCPEDTVWRTDGVEDFDHVETCVIMTPEEESVLAVYTDGDGWED